MTRTVPSGLTRLAGVAAVLAVCPLRAQERPRLSVLYTVKNQAYLTTCG